MLLLTIYSDTAVVYLVCDKTNGSFTFVHHDRKNNIYVSRYINSLCNSIHIRSFLFCSIFSWAILDFAYHPTPPQPVSQWLLQVLQQQML